MTYLQFHLVLTLPVLVALALAQRRPVAGVGARTSLGTLAAVVGLAVVYTTPWDNYLVYRGVWTYPPDAVVATIGYVPVEEYAFFVIQTVIAGLFYFMIRGRGMLQAAPAPMPRSFRAGVVAAFLALTAGGIALLFHPSDHALYMGLILAWAPPVMAGMAAVGASKIWAERYRVGFAITVISVYLWIVDRIAIGVGIWDIADAYRLHLDPLGLPLEEAVFFVATTTLCVFGLALFLPPARR
ncbi:MAG TPA: lycopene cyclase domain-containing protein [Rubricoccaceae bacterium]|jgi:lycopene cyclase domain-containing protein